MNKQNIKELVENYLIKHPKNIHALQVLQFLNQHDIFWQRENEYGHITSSAWVVNPTRDKVLLTHHKKLDIWVQLGGHVEPEDNSIYEACERELKEESGLKEFQLLSKEIFDIDVHKIPKSSSGFPEHFHFDIRFIFEANDEEVISFDPIESNKVRWISIKDISQFTQEESVIRMAEKVI